MRGDSSVRVATVVVVVVVLVGLSCAPALSLQVEGPHPLLRRGKASRESPWARGQVLGTIHPGGWSPPPTWVSINLKQSEKGKDSGDC